MVGCLEEKTDSLTTLQSPTPYPQLPATIVMRLNPKAEDSTATGRIQALK
ncbi:MAG: hypothetical protein F6K37_32100 [Moorea sp. SIO4E2]|nr:hypothetical protein [Moorena sp. SIO3A5]NEQ10407.1 hypothetical protein [Moorena sp. SIO4E2]